MGEGLGSDSQGLRETENADSFLVWGKEGGYKYWLFCSLWVVEWLCFCPQYKHQLEETKKEKRTRIPYKPNYSLNLWSIMKNCIGKELSKIPMPVRFLHTQALPCDHLLERHLGAWSLLP